MSEYVGIDLAWSIRARTGVAVVDVGGRLMASGSVVTDEELVQWLGDNTAGPEVIAVDAPLVVPNVTGQRRCERKIASAFGRYHAAAHTANRGMSYLDPPRAEMIAQHASWAIDPGSAARPLCLEVYPHPAMVGLWHLPRIIPYKAKSGRTVAARRAAFGELLGHLESVEELELRAHHRWHEIRDAVAGATRQVDLERIEDEIDAIFCAHLAWRWDHRPGSLTVYGDADEGYIVAPPRPAHPAAPRSLTPGPSPG